MGVRTLDFDDSFTSATAPTSANLAGFYNIIIGNTGEDFITHVDWDAYVAGTPANNDRILVITGQTLNATITLAVDDIDVEHFPGVEYTKGSVTKGFLLTGDRSIWDGGRFKDFSTGGDIAFELDAASSFVRLRNVLFNNCDTAWNDLGTANSILGNINETP